VVETRLTALSLQLVAVESKLDLLITKFEDDRRTVLSIDDRQVALENLSKQLASTEKHLASAVMSNDFRLAKLAAVLIVAAFAGGLTALRIHDSYARDAVYSHQQEGP
jgi:hypothetical protein